MKFECASSLNSSTATTSNIPGFTLGAADFGVDLQRRGSLARFNWERGSAFSAVEDVLAYRVHL